MLAPELSSSIRQWYALVQERVPTLGGLLKLDIDDYCSGKSPQPSNPTVKAMALVLEDHSDLKDALTQALGSNCTAVGTALLMMRHASLMVQHTSTKYRSMPVSTQEIMDAMTRARNEDFLNTRGPFKKTEQLLLCTIAVADMLPQDAQSCFFTALYKNTAPFLPGQALDAIEPAAIQERANLYVTLGHCALLSVGFELRQAQWHEKDWCNDIRALFSGPQPNKDLLANTIAASTLPAQYKLRVFKGLPATYWHLPAVKDVLLDSLPEYEHRRVEHLAWNKAHMQGNQLLDQRLCEANQRLVREYCPTLYPMLEFGLDPVAWLRQDCVANMAETFYMAQYQEKADAYTLPDDLGPQGL